MPYKIPESVLVVIHTRALDVLMIRRADVSTYWQGVTGAKDFIDESFDATAAREVFEETGIDCRPGTVLAHKLRDWQLENIYDIYPRWQSRYAPGVTRNTEHVFGLCVPAGIAVTLNVREHTEHCWLPHHAAADKCFSPSNAEAILLLPQFVE